MADMKRRLGRGLDSLLSPTRYETVEPEPQPAIQPVITEKREQEVVSTPMSAEIQKEKEFAGEIVAEIPLDRIQRNPHQPRFNWNDEKLQELADSIQANGLVQPIIVRAMGGGYQLIAGERRMRASQHAGLKTIKAIIKDANEEQMLEWALIENIHRDDLSPMERAKAYHKYISEFSLTQQEAADKLGEDRSNVANYMRLLALPAEVQEYVNAGILGMGHARALLSLSDPAEQKKLAILIERKGLSVRVVEKLVKDLKNKVNTGEEVEKAKPQKHPNIIDLENEMTQALGTKVSIQTKGKKAHQGKIIIDFYNLDDFDRLRDLLV